MRERGVASPHTAPSAAAAFPGATAVTVLDVYDWVAPDGLRGGSAHVHLASTEGYVVLSGAGRLQTLGERGYAETPLRPGDCLWFTPGTVHRLVNEGGLRLLVVMQNAGLPEHGDAVLTFPPEVLADPAAYARAASLKGAVAAAARRRRDLAIEGYLALRSRVAESGPDALGDFYAAALRLAGGHAADWRERWRAGALAAAELTGAQLADIAGHPAGDLAAGFLATAGGPVAAEPATAGHLASAGLWRIERPAGERSYGMCGRLTTYPASRAERAG